MQTITVIIYNTATNATYVIKKEGNFASQQTDDLCSFSLLLVAFFAHFLVTLENQLVKVFFFKTRHDKMSKKSNAKRVYFQV